MIWNLFNNGAIPRQQDRAKAYLCFKKWTSRFFEFKAARHGDGTVRVMLLASLNHSYVEGSADCLDLCGQTVRNHLRYQDPSRFVLLNSELVREMKKLGALSKPLTLAIDLHDEMYYGDPASEGVTGTQPKKGSRRAYRFATASVLQDGQRLTLAVVPIVKSSLHEQVRQLLNQILDLGVKIKLVLFDRGYFSAELINYLNALGVGYIIQLPASLKGLKEGQDCLYTTRGHRRRKSDQATFRLVTVKGRDAYGNLKLFIFATNTILKPRRMRKLYRKRWGIETSYRMIRKFLAKTTSRLYVRRKLYFHLAVLLYNLWVRLNYREEVGLRADDLRLGVELFVVLTVLSDMELPDELGG